MTKEEIVRKITMLCDDPNGFLVKLRVFNNFDELLFGEILDALTEYNDVLQGEPDINRHIAGFLVVLDRLYQGLLIILSKVSIQIRPKFKKHMQK